MHDAFHISSLPIFLRDEVVYQHIDLSEIELYPDDTYEERPIATLDRRQHRLLSKVLPLVQVQWGRHLEDESTWDREDDERIKYPELF